MAVLAVVAIAAAAPVVAAVVRVLVAVAEVVAITLASVAGLAVVAALAVAGVRVYRWWRRLWWGPMVSVAARAALAAPPRELDAPVQAPMRALQGVIIGAREVVR